MYSELRANAAEAENNMAIRYLRLALAPRSEQQRSESSAILGVEEKKESEENKIIVQDMSELDSEDAALPNSAQPAKDEYIIALYGDSMEDTMGEVGEYTDYELKKKYPHTRFNIYNYGMGSNNAEDSLARWNKPFHYMDRNYPSITEIEPDIIIMGSHAYNVFSPHNRDRHWLALTELVQRAQQLTPNVYILAEIAPIRRG